VGNGLSARFSPGSAPDARRNRAQCERLCANWNRGRQPVVATSWERYFGSGTNSSQASSMTAIA